MLVNYFSKSLPIIRKCEIL